MEPLDLWTHDLPENLQEDKNSNVLMVHIFIFNLQSNVWA